MSTAYMLDTDTCAFILRRSSAKLLNHIQTVSLDRQCMSVITLAELLYGVQVSTNKPANRREVDTLVRHVTVLEWSKQAAEDYADIRADLKKRGQIIGANDLLIAAHALSVGATLVTNNLNEFRRVNRLNVENWMQ